MANQILSDWGQRNPIVLGSHPLTRELIKREHDRLGHSGDRELRNHLHNYYHLVRGRRLIRSIVSTCQACNRQRGKSFVPPEPLLPSWRVEPTCIAFQSIGLDYMGPLKLRSQSKVYVLLATCAVTRLVHLETVTSLHANQCINALNRMFARRGIPNQIYSDNGRTFVGVNRALERLADLVRKEAERVPSQLPGGIRWSFQVPRAPWFGGFWERLVFNTPSSGKPPT